MKIAKLKFYSRLHRSQKMAAPSQNIARSRIPPATQASYFGYFTLRMCGALEPSGGALKPGALEPWGDQTAIHNFTALLKHYKAFVLIPCLLS